MDKNFRDALLFSGVPLSLVEGFAVKETRADPIMMTLVLTELHRLGALPDFFTFLFRHGFQLWNKNEFKEVLEPLGLEWNIELRQIRPTSSRPEAERQLKSELASLLQKLDPSFTQMSNGAWEAYYSNNPDRYRQSLSSCRELLRKVIDRLGGDKGTRREKVERIVQSRSTAEVIEASCQLVDSIYGAQSAGTHESKERSLALFVLVETEHLLYFLLQKANV
jgi:hypothetical protein